jgi:hypothetical protein
VGETGGSKVSEAVVCQRFNTAHSTLHNMEKHNMELKKAAHAAFITSIPDRSLSASNPMSVKILYSSLKPSLFARVKGLSGHTITNQPLNTNLQGM